ncbi:unnamed protein product [Microthlaspi erraticum]|uniref:F-box associated beta-propeller type 1 domain-containing protein n=1 Tax=Microthlaspi erraticum TaxID=1685480 RepID=A0A6D2I1Z5_9BRAS|nr:unnamed protein product [Microthlaspi erraticum]
MDGLPEHLIHKILFRINPRSLVNGDDALHRYLNSHIQDPYFISNYFPPGLLQISSHGSNLLSYQRYGDSRSRIGVKNTSTECQILGSCSGLLLLFIGDGLCVANPLTKKFRFLNLSRLMDVLGENTKHVGFAVNQTTPSFEIVHLFEAKKLNETSYEFEIYAGGGDSWRDSKTKITCQSSDLDNRMKNPVYLDGSLHWLRKDGGIVAFNPKTHEARLVPTKLPDELSLTALFTASDNKLTLVSPTKEITNVYALQDIKSDPKWVLVTRIQNMVLDVKRPVNVEAYDGRRLVLREVRKKKGVYDTVLHVYDLSADKWEVMGSIPGWCNSYRDIIQFQPSWSSVVGLDETVANCDDDKSISSLRSIIGLIDEEVGRKRTAEVEEEEENKQFSSKKIKLMEKEATEEEESRLQFFRITREGEHVYFD